MHLVSYDLNRPNQDYGAVIAAIKGLGDVEPVLKSAWLVCTDLEEAEVNRRVAAAGDEDDHFLVVEVAGGIYGRGVHPDIGNWLRNQLITAIDA